MYVLCGGGVVETGVGVVRRCLSVLHVGKLKYQITVNGKWYYFEPAEMKRWTWRNVTDERIGLRWGTGGWRCE